MGGEETAMKTIGLIGGMSWESTAIYYQIINREVGGRLGGLNSGKIVLYSVNFNIKDEIRLVDNKEFLLVSVKKLVYLMEEVGFKVKVYNKNGKETKNHQQPVFISGVKVKKRQ